MAAAKLFAEESYHSVGIRDIAKEAGVNSAMISYYFGGKSGLLREIFSRYAALVLEATRAAMGASVDLYDMCDKAVRKLLASARENRDIYLVGLRQTNHDLDELRDLREDLNAKGWVIFSENLQRLDAAGFQDTQIKAVIFTVVMGMIFSDYLLGGSKYIDDDTVVDLYTRAIVGVMKHGLPKLLA